MTKFRPCIDLHQGVVKQIVGSSLTLEGNAHSNFISTLPPEHYAGLYRDRDMRGGHVIMLGPGNEQAALQILKTWPDAFQIGGGINAKNAMSWLDQGAEKIIVTSALFPDGVFDMSQLRLLSEIAGSSRLVVDLSCRRVSSRSTPISQWMVTTEKWTRMTQFEINEENIEMLGEFSGEFLIHAADVEGLCRGMDLELITRLGQLVGGKKGCVYAGGGKEFGDLQVVEERSNGFVDLTFGSCLDIFGGSGVTLEECWTWNKSKK